MNCPHCQSTRAPKGKGIRGGFHTFVCRDCGKYFKRDGAESEAVVPHDKAEGVFDWREWAHHLTEGQALVDKASWSNKSAAVTIPGEYEVVVIKPLADCHFGSMGVDYASLADFTDKIEAIPYLYLCLLGDMTDNFAGFKSVMPVLAQGMSPAQQDRFLESWLESIAHKVLFSCWGNHEEFEERSTGRNTVRGILSKVGVYFDGIGVATIQHGEQSYKIAATHKTRNHSAINLTHGLKWLARRDIPDADAYLAGDRHDPAIEVSPMHGKEKIFMLLGTLKRRDSYGERYFSYFSAIRDGALTVNRRTHDMRAHACLADALEYAELVNRRPAAIETIYR